MKDKRENPNHRELIKADHLSYMAARIARESLRLELVLHSCPKLKTPRFGELLICLFVPLDRQNDQLGDFEEIFNTLWVPKFGIRLAKVIYILHALRSGAAILRIALVAKLVNRVFGLFPT